ncbi:MAG: hypothetical protein MZU95_00850 [Desulfomicrobium escambiense]|nr:hypothetical protein [Desulfomicrobium escambiense]
MPATRFSERSRTSWRRRVSRADCLPCLIGSLPLTDYVQAARLVWEYTPEIPLWVQLPKVPGESITRQFAAGMPGLAEEGGRAFVDTAGPDFEESLLRFYEEALALAGERRRAWTARGSPWPPDAAGGFFELIDQAKRRTPPPLAVKGQIVGPVTFGTSLCDRDGKAIFYDPQLRDAARQAAGPAGALAGPAARGPRPAGAAFHRRSGRSPASAPRFTSA